MFLFPIYRHPFLRLASLNLRKIQFGHEILLENHIFHSFERIRIYFHGWYILAHSFEVTKI